LQLGPECHHHFPEIVFGAGDKVLEIGREILRVIETVNTEIKAAT
jgi:hypothetical protein